MSMKTIRALLLTFFLCILGFQVVLAQGDELSLRVTKSYGYNSGEDIRGTFNLEVEGPQDLVSVTFLVDGKALATVNTAPFQTVIDTREYAPGRHDLSASGQTAGGASLVSKTRRFNFITSQEETAGLRQVMAPILGLVGGIFLLMLAAQAIAFRPGNRKQVPLGAARKFGALGGAICPKCHRAFGMHWWAPNLSFFSRYDRCEHCGRWSTVRRISANELEKAIQAEIENNQTQPGQPSPNPEDELRRQLEDSKYID